MSRVLNRAYGNPSSLYDHGRSSAAILEKARMQVADAINALPLDIIFTGCATESNNAVLKSMLNHSQPRRNKIISTPIEHPSVLKTLEYLKSHGMVIEFCPVDREGRVCLAELEKLVDAQTCLICCMLANNEIGTIQPIEAIVKIARKHEVLVFSDCVPAFGKMPVDVHALGIDYASFSAHKLYGPKGVGALYVKHGCPFTPLLHGGHQEEGLRAGTESLHNIAGFGAACEEIGALLRDGERIRGLKRQLVQRLKQIKPDCVINSPERDSLPNTLSVTFPNVNNSGLMAALDFRGIAVSAGSACSSQAETPSHVLKAIGVSDQSARETIRISLGHRTSARDIRYALRVIQSFFQSRVQPINMITPVRMDETILFDPHNYILDIRPQFMRRKVKSLPNSHEASFASIERYLHQFPRDKHIIVVCQQGYHATMAAYYLRSKGFGQVSILLSGAEGWQASRNDLYLKFAGQNITALQQKR
jgi:cysteine desulfurase